ncbi:methyl-accepting chemotaxis protein [Oxalobacteraceae bacterium GrIS 1.11]
MSTKKKFSLNIFQKLLITLLAVTLIPLVSLWYVGSNEAKKVLTYHISQSLVGTMNTVATSINGWDDTNVRTLRQAARLEDITSMKAERQNPVLKAISATYEWTSLVYTIAPDGSNIGRNDDKPQLQYGDRSYFQAVMKGQPMGRQVLISKTTGKPTLVLASPVRNLASSELLGVIAMTMSLDVVSKTVADIKVGETGHAILLDADNKVIAHGKPEMIKSTLQDFSAHPALKIDGITEKPMLFKDNGKEMVAFVRKLPQGWTLIVEQDYDEAFAALATMERNARILILLTAALVSAVAYFLGKQLTQPINYLTAIAQELSTGQFKVSIPQTARGDEIGSLARAIERLGISIQMAMERLRKKS